jgi:hypothetical protein
VEEEDESGTADDEVALRDVGARLGLVEDRVLGELKGV